jgi:CRP-like cAMP-binding protein
MLKSLAKDLKSADDNIVKMAQKSVAQRLGDMLLFCETQFGVIQSNLK